MSQDNGNANSNHSDFVSSFISFYSEMESPTSFWRWAGYSVIAATLREKVYYNYGTGRIYPNIYVVLLADSAEYRKGAPVIAVRSLLNALRITKVFSGTASIQAILDDLSQDIADAKTGVPIKDGPCIITADELSSFFVSDPRLIPLITDMWDPRIEPDRFPYKLRGGSIEVKNLCTNMLAASNETFLREVYDSRAVYGGLLGRTFMVKPDETRRPNSLMNLDISDEEVLNKYDKTPLLEALKEIKKLSGPVKITKEAAKHYDGWYKDLYSQYKKRQDRTGVLQRMHTNVLKLSIVLAAANYRLDITIDIFKEAIFQVTQLQKNYEIYVMSTGKSELKEIATKLLTELSLSSNYKISRKDFLGRYWAEVTNEDFEKVVKTLELGGIIELTITGTDVGYQMTSKGIEIFKKHEEKP